MIDQIAGWTAPAATMLAAVMTASNLGARVTGWGFVVFLVGSVAWCVVALTSSQSNLLWTNGFLVAVNILGVWRWLGRQARFEDGASAAADASQAGEMAAVEPLSGVIGQEVTGAAGEPLGRVVEALLGCDDKQIAYYVVSDGGVGGVGETLRGLDASEADGIAGGVRARLSADAFRARRPLEKDKWPPRLSPSHQRPA